MLMIRPEIQSTARTFLVLVCVVLVLISGAAGVGVVSAQNDPGDPQSFYGSIESEDGTPAPEGTEVFALVDDNVEDSLEINSAGEYGGSGPTADRLDINTGAGDEVVFSVGSPDGPQALESPFDLAEADQTPFELDLTFPDGTFDGASNFEIAINDEASTLEASEDEDLTVVADIENTGSIAGTQDITASVGATEVGSEEEVSLDSDASSTVRFVFAADPAFDGDDVVVASDDTTDAAPLAVSTDGAPGGGAGGGAGGGDQDVSGFFEVRDLDPTETVVDQGDSIDISAAITNTGGTGDQQTVELQIDGNTAGETSLTLPADGTETVVFENIDTSELDGEYEHSIATENDSQVGILTVSTEDEPPADDDGTGDDADDTSDDAHDDVADDDTDDTSDDAHDDVADDDAAEDDIPGFGAVVTLLALIMMGILFTRRSH